MNAKTHHRGAPPNTAPLTIIGRAGRGGVYVLRFHVAEPFVTPCGRFRNGKPVTFAAGEYLYVGRAMAQRGSVSLARRLVRHASRLGGGRPHPIREQMLAAFTAAGLCDGDVTPADPKRPRWNVDHPLDHRATTLTAAYLVRTGLDVEAALGKFLERDRGTVAFEPGLGANDVRGNTHLLRVVGGEAWWDALTGKLNGFAKLANMWPGRADDVLARVAVGTPYTRAVRESEGVYDTVGWHEVPSRLWRARGSVLKAAAVLGGASSHALDAGHRRAFVNLVNQVKVAVAHLRAALDEVGGERADDVEVSAIEAQSVTGGTAVPTSFKRVMGMLKLCLKFVEKNARDVPWIRRKTGARPAASDLARARAELARIDAGADQVLAAVATGGHSSPGRAA